MPCAVERVAVVTGGGRGIGRGIVMELAALQVLRRRELSIRSGIGAEAPVPRPRSRGAPHAIARSGRRGRSRQRPSPAARSPRGVRHESTSGSTTQGSPPRRRLDCSGNDSRKLGPSSGHQPPRPVLPDPSRRPACSSSRPESSTEPQIVFITSISSTFASVNRPEYCVAKAGLSMVAQLFAARLAEQGIRVYEIRPGLIETDMTRPVHAAYSERIAAGLSPIRRWGTPEDVGRAVAAIASGAFPFSTGEVIHVDGGLNLRIL